MISNIAKDWRGSVASSSLISAQELNALLGSDSVKIFDVRGTWATPACALPEEYAAGHIVGASFLDWTQHFIEQDVALGLAAVSDEAGAKQAFSALGINEGDLVVLYDDNSHMFSGRIWWAMRHWGFVDVRVLNGGWKYWSAQNMPAAKSVPELSPGTFKPSRQDELRIGLDAFLATYEQSCVIDARGSANYAGKADDPRTGHIPESINLPFSAMLDPETGLFIDQKSIVNFLDEQVENWQEIPIIASCGSGYAATVVLLALSELGKPASLFDGAFAQWKQDPKRSVAQSLPD